MVFKTPKYVLLITFVGYDSLPEGINCLRPVFELRSQDHLLYENILPQKDLFVKGVRAGDLAKVSVNTVLFFG